MKNSIISNKKRLAFMTIAIAICITIIIGENFRLDNLKEYSYQEGYDEGKEVGYKKGYDEGYSQGISEGTYRGQRSGYSRRYNDAQINTIPCVHCGGRGVNTCFFCNGEGCFTCSNTGLEKCHLCNGRGWNQY